jgi:hypothetical protein
MSVPLVPEGMPVKFRSTAAAVLTVAIYFLDTSDINQCKDQTMATVQGTTGSNEAAILSRVIRPEKDDLPDEQAKALLRMKFEQSDLDRLHELVVKNQDDELTPAEKEELEDYLRVSAFLDLMHAKARYSLRKKN